MTKINFTLFITKLIHLYLFSNSSSMKITAPDHGEGCNDGVSEQCFDNPGYESAASSVASRRTVGGWEHDP